MSDESTLELPFPHRRNPHYSQAAAHHHAWLRDHPQLAAGTAPSAYQQWDVTELAALVYPDCGPEDLGLAADLLGFYFLFDDQFDQPLGRRPGQVARICDRLIAIVYGAQPDDGSGVERAFGDLWRRIIRGMPAHWRHRAAYNWESYFASHPAEAAGRIATDPPDRASYRVLRRGTGAMESLFDMIERLNRFHVPKSAFHHPVLRRMHDLAAEIPTISNDIRSYPQEAANGDVYNLVMIVQRERRCSTDEARAVVLEEGQLIISQFHELNGGLAAACHGIELTAPDLAAAERYVDAMAVWVAGYLRWEAWTGRYRSAV